MRTAIVLYTRNRHGNSIGRVMVGIGLLILGVAAWCVWWLMQDDVRGEFRDPSGKYTAIVSARRYESLIPRMPGGGSDAAATIDIVDTAGNHFGRVPLPMAWLAYDLDWTSEGAAIAGMCRWDFRHKTYWYQDEDGVERSGTVIGGWLSL